MKTAFEKHGVVLAYLYGSQVTGKAGPLSDVDIAVLFSPGVSKGERFSRVLSLMADLAHVFRPDNVNVLDLDEGTPLVNDNVRSHGRVVYCADERARAEFVLRALHSLWIPSRCAANRIATCKRRYGEDFWGARFPSRGQGDNP